MELIWELERVALWPSVILLINYLDSLEHLVRLRNLQDVARRSEEKLESGEQFRRVPSLRIAAPYAWVRQHTKSM